MSCAIAKIFEAEKNWLDSQLRRKSMKDEMAQVLNEAARENANRLREHLSAVCCLCSSRDRA